MSSLPMGYEIQVTAIQMVAAVGALANKGAYMQPHVVKEILDYDGNTIEKFEPQYVRQVADPVACAKILDMMEQVVEKGTATSAKIDGYRVGGKTGTTKKTVNGHYVNDYISSFCGVAPIEDPEVCIYVYVDSPKGSYYGGVVAAPIFREIAREAMKVLRIPENRKTMPEKEFQVTLDKVRNRIEGRAPKELISIARADENEPIADDVVPDLQGLTMAEAVRRAASVGMEVYTTEGSGIVYEQEPKANEIREGAKGISVKMANSADYVAMLARKYNDLYGQESEERVAAAEEVTGGDLLSTESMSLTLGGRALPLAMADNPAISLVPAGTRETPAVPAAAPDELFPDLDPYANTPVDVGANKKSWANFEKEMKEMEDRAKERGDADTAAEQDADTQPVALILDVPVFDGSEDYDPSTTQLKPVEILAPSAEEIREGTTPKPLQSLYDL